jgi:hypothetical protein
MHTVRILVRRILLIAATAVWATQVFAAKQPTPEATPLDLAVAPGAQHIVIKEGDDDLRQIFTYFPYPPRPIDTWNRVLPLHRNGVYRLEVTPEGKIAAVTILKTMGKNLDYSVLKTIVNWKAKPGALRVVDMTWHFWASGISRYNH